MFGNGSKDEDNLAAENARKAVINKISSDDVETFEFEATRLGVLNIANYYQNIAIKSAIYPGRGTSLGLIYCALKLNGEAGELAEHVGKAMRDDNLIAVGAQWNDGSGKLVNSGLTFERREFIIKEIGDCLWYCSALCKELGISLSYAMLVNLKKLAARTAKNTLRGSGDER